MTRLVSFEVSADFGFFKKPDINKIGLTYNLPPKPAILGLLGSILGLKGHKQHYEENAMKKENVQSFPEYCSKLAHLKIGITPLGDFPFNKIMNKYNSKNSYYYTRTDSGSRVDTGNIIEQLLIKPRFRLYLFTNKDIDKLFDKLVSNISNNCSIYTPYLGKNDFILTINNFSKEDLGGHSNFKEYSLKPKIKIKTIFLMNQANINQKNMAEEFPTPIIMNVEGLNKDEYGKPVIDKDFRENYPIGYLDSSLQYNLKLARYTTFEVIKEQIDTEEGILLENDKEMVYLF